MDELNTQSLESALGAAFMPEAKAPAAKAPVAPKAPAKAAREPEPDEIEQILQAPAAPVEEDPADLLAGEPEEAVEVEAPVSEPEYEIEVEPGKPEVIRGTDRVKELITRGLKAGRGFEENARVRQVLQAQVAQVQAQQQFHSAVSGDIASIQALEQQLQAYDRYDWNAAYDSNPFEALKLKEQRDQLREQRAAAFNNLNAKRQQFDAHLKENTQKILATEYEALLAKVPAWRNAEKAKQEHGEISNSLVSLYGFSDEEAKSVTDHRMILVARDAAAYRKLLANKDARVKQAREAPPNAKPGAAAQPNERAGFNKIRGKIKELGTKGNHRAQEELATKLFERTFK